MGLNKKEMASYGIGAVGKDMVYMFCASYILYYYQDILGVSAIAMGIILLAARVFDAFNDPIMGVVVAKTRTRWGKFRPWLFIGTLLNAVVLFLMFSAPPTLDGGGLVAYAAVTYVLWGVTYTMLVTQLVAFPFAIIFGRLASKYSTGRLINCLHNSVHRNYSICSIYEKPVAVLGISYICWYVSGRHTGVVTFLFCKDNTG